MIRPTLALLAALLLTRAAAGAQNAAPAALQDARAHWAVQGADAETQRLIDRGVLMLYAFDVGEARVAFGDAIKHDPDAALAYWGEAEADTIDINEPQTEAGDRRAAIAVEAGRRHLAHASETERVLVDAIAKRYGPGTKRERFTRYADALSAWTKGHRDDPNVLAVAAYAIWNAEDNLLDSHQEPTARAREMLADLDDALKLEPSNLGAHHLRIHLLEQLHRSQEAVPDADALRSYGYPPGASHLAHMAGHIWSRIGDYAKMVDDNERAVANDEAWFAQGDGPGQQYMRNYHDHDVDFVLYGLTTVGRNDEARAFAKHEDTAMQIKAALRMHDDAHVGELAKTGGGITALAAYVAAARRGDEPAARAARARLAEDKARAHAPLADVAAALLARDTTACVAAYARAYEGAKTGSLGDPKTSWQLPIGEGYGAALLQANRFADAEKVFAAELRRYPNDPHLEWGLAEAMKASGKDDAAPRAAYRSHWKGARDLTLADLG
jgi:hypothetical protein